MPSISSPTPDATTTTKGKSALAGDLSGTADAPIVANGKITPSKLNTGATSASDSGAVSTSSSTYVTLAGNPQVTVNIGVNGLALVTVTSLHYNTNAGQDTYHSFAVSGASTQAATDSRATSSNGTPGVTSSTTTLVTGLTAGSNTFTSVYRTSGGSGTFINKSISVVPL